MRASSSASPGPTGWCGRATARSSATRTSSPISPPSTGSTDCVPDHGGAREDFRRDRAEALFRRSSDATMSASMNAMTRIRHAGAALRPCVSCWHAGAGCAEYPEKPIRLLLPFPAGGAVDIVARAGRREAGRRSRQAVRDREQGRRRRHHRDRRRRQGRRPTATRCCSPRRTTPSTRRCSRRCPTTPRRTSRRSRSWPRCRRCWSAIRRRRSRPSRSSSTTPRKIPASSTTPRPASARCRTSPWNCCCDAPASQVAHIPYRGAAPAMTDLLSGAGAAQARHLRDLAIRTSPPASSACSASPAAHAPS